MKNILYLTLVLIFIPFLCKGQNKMFEDALKKGRLADEFYVAENKTTKIFTIEDIVSYAKNNNYILSSEYQTKNMSRFGHAVKSVSSIGFLPKSEIGSYIFSKYIVIRQPVRESISFDDLKEHEGTMYFFHPQKNEFLTIEDVFWCKNEEGYISYGFKQKDERTFYFFIGAFQDGMLNGKGIFTVYTLENENSHPDNGTLIEKTINVGAFKEGLALVQIGEGFRFNSYNYGLINKKGEMIPLEGVRDDSPAKSELRNKMRDSITKVNENNKVKGIYGYQNFDLQYLAKGSVVSYVDMLWYNDVPFYEVLGLNIHEKKCYVYINISPFPFKWREKGFYEGEHFTLFSKTKQFKWKWGLDGKVVTKQDGTGYIPDQGEGFCVKVEFPEFNVEDVFSLTYYAGRGSIHGSTGDAFTFVPNPNYSASKKETFAYNSLVSPSKIESEKYEKISEFLSSQKAPNTFKIMSGKGNVTVGAGKDGFCLYLYISDSDIFSSVAEPDNYFVTLFDKDGRIVESKNDKWKDDIHTCGNNYPFTLQINYIRSRDKTAQLIRILFPDKGDYHIRIID